MDRQKNGPNDSMGTIRFVQRKFAQGVHVPHNNNNVTPAAPERKPETKDGPSNVYHNGMSAQSLLDIVSLQNTHQHKRPMMLVMLERLKNVSPSPPPHVTVLKRRKPIKIKNNMCLRSMGKRTKKIDAAKKLRLKKAGVKKLKLLRKRKCVEISNAPKSKRSCPRAIRSSSECSLDDMPLLYLANTRKDSSQGSSKDKASPEKSPETKNKASIKPPLKSDKKTLHKSPMRSPQRSPQIYPQRSPQRFPQRSQQRLPQRSPQSSPQRSPQRFPQRSPQSSPQRSPQRFPQRSPQSSPQRSPQRVPRSPQSSPQSFPQRSPQRSLQNSPQRKPQKVLQKSIQKSSQNSPPTTRLKKRSVENGVTKDDGFSFTVPSQVSLSRIRRISKSVTASGGATTRARSVLPAITPVSVRLSPLHKKALMAGLKKSGLQKPKAQATDANVQTKIPDIPEPSTSGIKKSSSQRSNLSSSESDVPHCLEVQAEIHSEVQGKPRTEVTQPQPTTSGMDKDTQKSNFTNSVDDESDIVRLFPREVNSGSNGDYYGPNEIDQWIGVGISSADAVTSVTPPAQSEPPIVEPPTVEPQSSPKTPIIDICSDTSDSVEFKNEILPSNGGQVESMSPTRCPSSRFNSVHEAVLATSTMNRDLENRCRKCEDCSIINKIDELMKLVKPCQKSGSSGDVYDFNAETDDASPVTSFKTHRAKPDNAEETHLYLDVFPAQNPHIIKISSVKMPQQKNPITNARLMNKSELPAEELVQIDKKKRLDINESKALATLMTALGQPIDLDSVKSAPDNAESIVIDENSLCSEKSDVNEPSTSRAALEELRATRSASVASKESSIVDDAVKMLEAPKFHPTEEEFKDPIAYFEKIAPIAMKYGQCIVVPPESFKPPCHLNSNIRFAVIHQYLGKLYSRWGPVTREMSAIKAYLRTQKVVFSRAPLLEGVEVNLPKLYHAVQRNGGLKKVIQRKRWNRVADEMGLHKLHRPDKKLDKIYLRCLLPYDTLSNQERHELMQSVEKCWNTKYGKMLERASNPLHRQKKLLGQSDSSEDEEESETYGAVAEAEDCIVQGRTMKLATYKKVAGVLMDMNFPNMKPGTETVEEAYWKAVVDGTDHIIGNTASIDTGEEGYGFPKEDGEPYADHPWNLKMIAKNPGNMLSYLGPVLGVTVPTLHLGMVFSTSCWHRDPHGLPWIDFMHNGPEKIWYGIPANQAANFRKAVEVLCPAYCQNKSIWLASDIAMIPPSILSSHGVTMSRLVQRPREFVLVCSEAFSCSIATGYTVSESVYCAPMTWLNNVQNLFQELRESCEPTMFSLEQLVMSINREPRAPAHVLYPACVMLAKILTDELSHREQLAAKNIPIRPFVQPKRTTPRAWNSRDQEECDFCRSTLHISKLTGLTRKKSAVCLEHAIRLLNSSKYKDFDITVLEITSPFTTQMLKDTLAGVEKRIADGQP